MLTREILAGFAHLPQSLTPEAPLQDILQIATQHQDSDRRMSFQQGGPGTLTIQRLDIIATARTANLMKTVEADYGRKVLYVLDQSIPERAAARLDRNDDTPVIEFRAETEADETTIFHELCHLQLLARGFPLYRFVPTPDMLPYKEMIFRVYSRVRAAMQHALFFPTMRQQGFDPTMKMRSAIAAMGPSQRGSRGRDQNDFELAADLVGTHLAGDEEALEEHIAILRKAGWIYSIEKAKQACELIQQYGFDQPRREADALVGALDVLFDGRPRPMLRNWFENTQKRPTYSLNEVELVL